MVKTGLIIISPQKSESLKLTVVIEGRDTHTVCIRYFDKLNFVWFGIKREATVTAASKVILVSKVLKFTSPNQLTHSFTLKLIRYHHFVFFVQVKPKLFIHRVAQGSGRRSKNTFFKEREREREGERERERRVLSSF